MFLGNEVIHRKLKNGKMQSSNVEHANGCINDHILGKLISKRSRVFENQKFIEPKGISGSEGEYSHHRNTWIQPCRCYQGVKQKIKSVGLQARSGLNRINSSRVA